MAAGAIAAWPQVPLRHGRNKVREVELGDSSVWCGLQQHEGRGEEGRGEEGGEKSTWR